MAQDLTAVEHDTYVKHFVAFVDILGYKDLVMGVKDTTEAMSTVRMLKSAVEQARSTLETRFGWQQDNLAVRIFSDSIILATPARIENFDAFFQLVAKAQANLVRGGILVRGALAIGHHYADETIVFSEGLVSAYTLETTVARFPRILVPDEFWGFVTTHGYDEDIIWFKDTYVWRDTKDGEMFIDYLNFMPYTRRDDPQHEGRDLRSHRDLVLAGLDAHQTRAGVLPKFTWLAGYHNTWCNHFYPDRPNLLIARTW